MEIATHVSAAILSYLSCVTFRTLNHKMAKLTTKTTELIFSVHETAYAIILEP